ncbi:MAG TPA: LLM class flavin-dependent oxidoreductase [Alphaproteobacteria bacterium]
MEFGIQFFPDVNPDEKPADQYWQESLFLTGLLDELGYTHVRTVEHYFKSYGGYSPNPIVFLSAAAQRTRKARLITGAVLPIFNHPLKLAGEIGMLDAISGGRAEIGFARAFLPHEFARFGRPLDESRARFDEGLNQVKQLLEREDVSSEGKFHSYKNVTSLPRPTQKPRPPFWVAASSSDESFIYAGKNGYGIMIVPRAADQMKKWIASYRQSWREAGHPGQGSVMIAFHMYTSNDREEAYETARPRLDGYFHSLVEATQEWTEGLQSKDYPNHPKMMQFLKSGTFESRIQQGATWIGTPADVREIVTRYDQAVGGLDIASLQVNFSTMPVDAAERSMRLFAREVMPHFQKRASAA